MDGLPWIAWLTAILAVPGAWAQQARKPIPFNWRGARVEETYRGQQVLENPGRLILEGGCVEGEGILLLADRITYDAETGELEALGNIRLEGPGIRLRCGRLTMNWGQQAGEAFALELEVDPDWTLKADRVAFHTLQHWQFDQVEVNACPQEVPGWTARIAHLKLNLNRYATLKGAWIWLGKVPTPYYLPWAIYPAKQERTSGLLPIGLGLRFESGSKWYQPKVLLEQLTLPYYQTLGPTADFTFSPEYHRGKGILWGGELRWQPETSHAGAFTGQLIHERMDDRERRHRFGLKELWQREDGWTLAADVNHASDTLLEADYGRGVGGLGASTFDSSVYVGRNFALGSFSVAASEQRSFFLPEDPLYKSNFPTNFRRQALPEAQLRFYPVALGRLYLDGGARVGRHAYRLQLEEEAPTGHYSWGRDDLHARLQGRLGQMGPVRADMQLMVRYTRYGASLKDPFFNTEQGVSGFQDALESEALSPFEVDGPQLVRRMMSSRLQFSGPQVGRSFPGFSLLGWKGELRHVVEPFVAFTANSGFSQAGRVPRFDEVDGRPGVLGSAMGEQSVEFGFRQHVLGRPNAGVPFLDLLRWRTSVRFHVRPVLLPDGRTQKKGWGSMDNELDFEPDETIRISFRRSSEVGESSADNSLSADFKSGESSRVSFAVFSTGLNRFLVRQRGVQVGGLHRFLDDRLRFEYSANYAFSRQTSLGPKGAGFASSQVALTYVTPCLATSLRYFHVALNPAFQRGKEDRIELGLTLRGLGELFKNRW